MTKQINLSTMSLADMIAAYHLVAKCSSTSVGCMTEVFRSQREVGVTGWLPAGDWGRQFPYMELFRNDPAAGELQRYGAVSIQGMKNRMRQTWSIDPKGGQKELMDQIHATGLPLLIVFREYDGSLAYAARYDPHMASPGGTAGRGASGHNGPFWIIQPKGLLHDPLMASGVYDFGTTPPWERVEGDSLIC